MPSKINYSAELEQARHAATVTAVGNGGKLWLYGGAQPVSAGTSSHGQPLLAGPFILASPFAGAATSALPSILSPTLPANINASGSSQPTWYRVTSSGGSDGSGGVFDGSAGLSGCDLTIGVTTSGQPVAITAWTITSANYGH